MEAAGLTARPKRRFGNKVQWVVTLGNPSKPHDGRLGEWVVVEIDKSATEEDVARTLTRAQRRRATSIKLVTRFKQAA